MQLFGKDCKTLEKVTTLDFLPAAGGSNQHKPLCTTSKHGHVPLPSGGSHDRSLGIPLAESAVPASCRLFSVTERDRLRHEPAFLSDTELSGVATDFSESCTIVDANMVTIKIKG